MGRDMDGFQVMMSDFKIQKKLDKHAYLVVGAVASLKSRALCPPAADTSSTLLHFLVPSHLINLT